MNTVEVWLWGTHVASLTADSDGRVSFRYLPSFVGSGIQVAPLLMPLDNRVHANFERRGETFKGLPPLVIDSLPDKFGEALIAQWAAREGRSSQLTPLERLCYTGTRGMGALEFWPATERPDAPEDDELDVAQLVALASEALKTKAGLSSALTERDDFVQILSVGTSAGGARAKAVIAFDPDTQEVRSGQASDLPAGFEHWLLKFDGVDENRDKELADPLGYGRIEFAYSEMAKAAGIEMTECRLLEEGSRAHFMTRRFDRVEANQKLHYASLCAIAGYDFNLRQGTSYEMAIEVMRRLELGFDEIEQQVLRALFNVVARNQDDHTKNIGYLMDRSGRWSLSPAFDITFSYNPDGDWTAAHQMTIAGKADGWERAEIESSLARAAGMDESRVASMLDDVVAVVGEWPVFATDAGVDPVMVAEREQFLRLSS